MYKVKQEVFYDGKQYFPGDPIENPSTRMMDLDIVEKVNGEQEECKGGGCSLDLPEVQETPEVLTETAELVDKIDALLVDDSSDVQLEESSEEPTEEVTDPEVEAEVETTAKSRKTKKD